jgi:hypothetical protein
MRRVAKVMTRREVDLVAARSVDRLGRFLPDLQGQQDAKLLADLT